MTDTLKPKISVLTQSCFVQCDTPVLPELSKDALISWDIFYLVEDSYSDQELNDIHNHAAQAGIDVRTHKFAHRLRSIFTLMRFWGLLLNIRRSNPSTLYINAIGLPWLAPLVRCLFDPSRVVWAVHDVMDHHIQSKFHPVNLYRRFQYSSFKRFHLLSRNQLSVFQKLKPNAFSYYAPHAPIDYGPKNGAPDPSITTFLFFGRIAPRKGLEILIQAAEILFTQGYENFRVIIAGRCDDWESYSKYIIHPHIFELHISSIPNSEVARLYSISNWLVLPYRELTQSGPMSLAYHYQVPVIASNLPQFHEFIEDHANGLLFQVDQVEELSKCMKNALSPNVFNSASVSQKSFFDSHFSMRMCISAYRDFLLPQNQRPLL